MSNVTPFNGSQISSVFGGSPVQNDLASGIASSFAIVGYKGKVWSTKYRGEEKKLLREDGSGDPISSIEVIILAASKNLTKTYYIAGYVEGSNAAPDCFSNNGVTPDPSSVHLQSPTCASCPRNVWGSSISPVTGKPRKECQDNKRLVVVPFGDIRNEARGGPMLLRVPAASLQDLAQFGNKMSQLGYPSYSFATRIGFDPEAAYPKFRFSPIRPLTDDEAKQVMVMRNDPTVARILAETPEALGQQPQQAPSVFEVEGTWSPPQQTSTISPPSAPPAAVDTRSMTIEAPASPVATPTTPAPAPISVSSPATSVTPTPPSGTDEDGSATTASSEPTAPIGSTELPTLSAFEKELDGMLGKLLP